MAKVFAGSEINGMVLPNRFVRSATWEGMATHDGAVTKKLTDTVVDLVKGGIGLIISGHAYVSPEGQAKPWQMGVHKDELIPGLKKLCTAVHDCGGKIVMQIGHAGILADEKLTGLMPLVVSAQGEHGTPLGRQIKERDIKNIVAAFAKGASRAKLAGFDGVQIHCAHGYLLSQFLSSAFNHRQDQYGGDIHNRARILIEVYQGIREAVGEGFPVLIKLNCKDFIDNGLNLDESIMVGCKLAEAGIDAIELSGGMLTKGGRSPSGPGKTPKGNLPYYRQEALDFKSAINKPLILVGGIRDFNVAESLVEDGVADYIAMCRPFIKEPYLINRWQSGDRRAAECKSCNGCFRMGGSGTGICCIIKSKQESCQSIGN